MLYHIIGVGDFGVYRRDSCLFLEPETVYSNVVVMSHIIPENDPHLFRSLLSVGDRPV